MSGVGEAKVKGSRWNRAPDICGNRIQNTGKGCVAVGGSGISLSIQFPTF